MVVIRQDGSWIGQHFGGGSVAVEDFVCVPQPTSAFYRRSADNDWISKPRVSALTSPLDDAMVVGVELQHFNAVPPESNSSVFVDDRQHGSC